jgi:cysteine desulfurase/selenocysteine lyase
MPFPPFRTWRATIDWSGFSSSRFGPIWPFAPAALSVWQLAQPALAKTLPPGEFEAPEPPHPPAVKAIARRSAQLRERGFMDRVPRYDSQVAVTARSTLDAQKLRADFPIFEQKIHGKPLAYLDSAVTSQKPRQVLDKMRTFYETSYANVHRGVYTLSELATAEFEQARQKVAGFVNAPSAREIIFTRQATEALNLVAYAWGLNNLGPGDVVVVTELEHHSNFVPWQYIAKKTGASFRMVHLTEEGELDLADLDPIGREGNVKVVANNLVSNALGTINPVEKIAEWAHDQGAIMVVDGAQAAPHHPIDVQALGCDFLAFSAHKMCGPTGVGALWGRLELLEAMEPFNLGGHMIRKVRLEETTWGDVPHKFEAGTSPIAEAIGLGAAIDYLEAIGLEAIEAYEQELAAYALERLADVPGIVLYGPPPDRRAGIVSFNLGDIHPHDVAQVLDSEGVAIRAGHHCCQPLMTRLGVAATNRASFYLYTVREEIDRLVEGIQKAHKLLG